MQVVVLNGVLSEAEQNAYIQRAAEKYPMSFIEKLILEIQPDGVQVSYLLHRTRELRKMGGYYIGEPESWNCAKQAELRDTIPNRID